MLAHAGKHLTTELSNGLRQGMPNDKAEIRSPGDFRRSGAKSKENFMTEQKQLTALVRAMKAALKADHRIEVPYSALRASYLKANGKNPHAFGNTGGSPAGGKSVLTQMQVENELLETHTLYLVGDESGCLTNLAFDAEGEFLLRPQDPLLKFAKVSGQYAQVPSINRYGLPVYLEDATSFYLNNFGLALAGSYAAEVIDLGDDSGDTCSVDLALKRGVWLDMLWSAMGRHIGTRAKVGEWVGLHYSKNFDGESETSKAEWFERYLESRAEDLSENTEPELVTAAANAGASIVKNEETPSTGPFSYVEGTFEWVYPDEDSDNTQVRVDRKTGRITFLEEVTAEIESDVVRCRMNSQDILFDVRLIQLDKEKYWKVRPKDLKEFIAETESFFNQLAPEDFDVTTIVEASNHGMLGEFSVKSIDGAFKLTATYSKHEPDNSNDNARSKGTMSIALAYADGHERAGQILAKRTKPYVFHGEDLGGHLQELFEEYELLDILFKR